MKCDIYTDGCCKNNGSELNIGGWAAVIRNSVPNCILGVRRSIPSEDNIFHHEKNTTNNRMELTAVIKALEHVSQYPEHLEITIFSDSQYLILGITKWIKQWINDDWMRVNLKGETTPVKNKDLWEKLFNLVSRFPGSIKFKHVQAHAGIPENELADLLAKKAMANSYKDEKWI